MHVRDAHDLDSTVVAANKIPEVCYFLPATPPKCHTLRNKPFVQVDRPSMLVELSIGQILAKPLRIIRLEEVSTTRQTDRKGHPTAFSKALITMMAYGSTGWFSDFCIAPSAHLSICTITVSIVL